MTPAASNTSAVLSLLFFHLRISLPVRSCGVKTSPSRHRRGICDMYSSLRRWASARFCRSARWVRIRE